MTASSSSSQPASAPAPRAPSETFENVACPFCGILCDDLEIRRDGSKIKVLKNGCARAAAGFERPVAAANPQIAGRDVTREAAVAEAARLLRPSGRLVIVDFAPHKLEFLRDEHAHQRLGFSDRQIGDWFAEAGLDLEEVQDFEPRGGSEDRLTVKLWLGRDRRLLIADPASTTQPAALRQFGETA